MDISDYLGNLPLGRNTRDFSTEDASGSTSQAANIQVCSILWISGSAHLLLLLILVSSLFATTGGAGNGLCVPAAGRGHVCQQFHVP